MTRPDPDGCVDMMDNGPSPPPTAGSLLGLHGGAGAASQLSPYLNVNPAYLQSQTPEYIFNQVGTENNYLRLLLAGNILVSLRLL